MTQHEKIKLAADAAARTLMDEFGFDGVVILASHREEHGETSLMCHCEGNYHANVGMLTIMAERCKEESRISERRRQDANERE